MNLHLQNRILLAAAAVLLALASLTPAITVISDLNTGLDWMVLDQENDNDADGQVARTGTWERVVLGGNSFNGIGHRAEASSSATNTWTYFNLTPGTYEVAANWALRPGQATAPGAQYAINGNTPFFVLQNPDSVGPPELIDLGGAGSPSVNPTQFQIISSDTGVGAGGTLSVVLSDVPTGRVMADAIAIRLIPSGGSPPSPEIILSTDFTGRTIAGSTASNIPWIANGVADPGDLAAMMNPDGLFDTGDAQGRFAPDRNIHNEGDWSVDIPLNVGGSAIDLTTIDLDAFITNNSGALQSVSRDLDLTLQLLDGSMTVIDSDSILNIFPGSGSAAPNPRTVSFDLSGNTLLAQGMYFLRLIATGQGPGNNAGFDNLNVSGVITAANTIPEPATATLGLLALGGLLLRRRRAA